MIGYIEHGDTNPSVHPTGNRGSHPLPGFNSVADEAALAALEATCDASDRIRVVEQTGGEQPGLYYFNGTEFKRLDPGALEAAQFPGHDRRVRGLGPPGDAAIALADSGGTATLPGPEIGFVRFYSLIQITPTGASVAASITAIHQPSGLHLKRAFAVSATSNISSNLTSAGAFVLAAGESVELTNGAASGGTATLWYTYFDRPVDADAPIFTVAKALNGATPIELIPAAPSGYFHRIVSGLVHGTGYQGGPRQAFTAYNDDTVSQVFYVYLDGVLASKAPGAPAATTSTGTTGGHGPDFAVTTKALAYGLAGAATTRNPNVFLAYERLPLP